MSPKIYDCASRNTNKVAITFDDGPNPPNTEEVLNILGAKGVRCSFFLIGKWAKKYPRTVDRLVAANQVIGNHGYSHQYGVTDFEQAELVIAHMTGKRSKFIRAPFLAEEAYKDLSSEFLSLVNIVHCDIIPNEYLLESEKEIIASIFEKKAVSGGSIICIHDGSHDPNPSNRLLRPLTLIKALPEIITRIIDLGLDIVGLDEMPL